MSALTHPEILDQFGRPYPKTNGRPRAELAEAFAAAESEKARSRRGISAKYDGAGSGTEHENIWGEADTLDADSANSQSVRETLVKRSRYEHESNGFASGIESTYADDLIGIGPTLRMQTGSEGFNRMVEREWKAWAKEIKLRRKLWCQAHAYGQDGEGLGIVRRNRGLRHPVKLDYCLYETEQCQTPLLPYGEPGYIDGIKFDEFGNAVWYDILKQHPGSNQTYRFTLEAERVPARFVAHWFKLRRPGQHRGVPEGTSTLNCGAASRRFRESVLAAADNIAEFAIFLQTNMDPNEAAALTPMSTLDIQRRMMTALPEGWNAFQPDAKQPVATYSDFNRSLINEQAHPRCMPVNKAMANHSEDSFASGRLDHLPYHYHIDIDREDCVDLVLDPVFAVWFEFAVVALGWLGGDPEAIRDGAKAHTWDFPGHAVADEKSKATANQTKLQSGQTSLAAIYSSDGLDYEDSVIAEAAANGITPEQQKQIKLLSTVPAHAINAVSAVLGLSVQAETPEPDEPERDSEDDDDET